MNKWKLKELVRELPDNKGSEWVDEGKCLHENPDRFVYASAMPTLSERYQLKKICEGCPVILECRYEAVRNLDQGWWGGMDERERLEWAENELLSKQ